MVRRLANDRAPVCSALHLRWVGSRICPQRHRCKGMLIRQRLVGFDQGSVSGLLSMRFLGGIGGINIDYQSPVGRVLLVVNVDRTVARFNRAG